MQVTEVNVKLMEVKNPEIIAFASVVLDNAIKISDIAVKTYQDRDTGEDRTVIKFPFKILKDGKTRKDIAHPVNKDTHNLIYDAIIDKYNELVAADNAAADQAPAQAAAPKN